MYAPSDTGLEWLGEGPLYKLVLNKRQGIQAAATIQVISGPLLKPGLGLLFRYDTHQTINRRLEQVYLPSNPVFEWPGERPLFQLDLKKCMALKCGHYSSHPLRHYLCQAWGPWPGKASA